MFPPVITKKLSSSRIVWFEPSNRWVYLEEPAWYVYSMIRRHESSETIVRRFYSRYGLSCEESMRFVLEISGALKKLEEPLPVVPMDRPSSSVINSLKFKPFTTRFYLMNKRFISVSYGSDISEYYIHPPLAHLETNYAKKITAHFDIFEHENLPVIRKKGDSGFASSGMDFSQIKKKLFMELANLIHNKTHEKWMSFLHASGISNGKETILLSSASGSGKSTMAALLHAENFDLVSDDFIPLDVRNKHAWPFPAAISVKKGAFSVLSPHYGNLHDPDYNIYPHAHSTIRFLRPLPAKPFSYKPLPVKSIIFIKYNQECSDSLTPLPVPEALTLFHEQAWVSHNPSHARAFINWFVKLKCWRMEYSDSEKAMDRVKEIFRIS